MLVFVVDQHLVGISAVMLVVFYRDTMSKLEVHSISLRRQRRTKPRPRAACTKKIGEVRPRAF